MTDQKNIKRTIVITLVLISSVSLKACASRKDNREVYRNLEDCIRDWGAIERCERVTNGHLSGYYYGPQYYRSGGSIYYYRNSSSGYQPVPSNLGIVKSPSGKSTTSVGRVTRGGFGSRGGRSSSFGSRGGSGSRGRSSFGSRGGGKG